MMGRWIWIALFPFALPALAQPIAAPANVGTLLTMSGIAEVELPNDEAVANFYFEAQDADLAKAQALVNQRVGDGTAALKRADPKAQVETSGYGSFPVYGSGNRNIVGWRVRQGVTFRTDNLANLPKTVASAQSLLSLGGIDFRLSRAARDKVEGELIQQAIANFNARVAAAAQTLGVPANRIRVEELNFGSREGGPIPMAARMAAMASDAVPAPSFEAGRSSERMTVSGKARLLP